jgi:uncharacterized protein YjiS (DUF1127 family)
MSFSTIEASAARRADPSAGSWPAALTRPIRQGLAWIGSQRRLRRDIKELMALDDRILRDIGLSRCDVEHGARCGRMCDHPRDRLGW